MSDDESNGKEVMINRLKRFIPQKIPNKIVLAVLKGLAKTEAGLKKLSINALRLTESRREYNMDVLLNGSIQKGGIKKIFYQPGKYIENQRQWECVKFGKSNMSYSGCEIMAVYNALKALGGKVSAETVADLIVTFERNGAVLGGKFGTAPCAIEDYFREQGYDVMTTISTDTAVINELGEKSDTVIVYAYNDKNDIMAMIHTVNITRDAAGTYSVHNACYMNEHKEYAAKGGCAVLQDAINAISVNPASIEVIGISRQKDKIY